MKKILLPLVVMVTVMVSCQKEIDWGLGNNNNNPQDKLLVKIHSSTGSDSTVIEYTYDANKRVIMEKTTGIAAGTDLANELKINRNSAGIITSTVQKAAALTAAGIDSVVTRYNYSSAASRYTSSIFDLAIPGFAVQDSAVYSYDASGKITSDSHYLLILGLPIPAPPVLVLKDKYTYTGANLTVLAQDAATTPGGPLSPLSNQTFTFDSKTNPLIIGNEAIVLMRTGLFNANNPTQVVLTNTASPSNDFTMDYIYKYNSFGKPDSSYGTRTPGASVTATKYFYQ